MRRQRWLTRMAADPLGAGSGVSGVECHGVPPGAGRSGLSGRDLHFDVESRGRNSLRPQTGDTRELSGPPRAATKVRNRSGRAIERSRSRSRRLASGAHLAGSPGIREVQPVLSQGDQVVTAHRQPDVGLQALGSLCMMSVNAPSCSIPRYMRSRSSRCSRRAIRNGLLALTVDARQPTGQFLQGGSALLWCAIDAWASSLDESPLAHGSGRGLGSGAPRDSMGFLTIGYAYGQCVATTAPRQVRRVSRRDRRDQRHMQMASGILGPVPTKLGGRLKVRCRRGLESGTKARSGTASQMALIAERPPWSSPEPTTELVGGSGARTESNAH